MATVFFGKMKNSGTLVVVRTTDPNSNALTKTNYKIFHFAAMNNIGFATTNYNYLQVKFLFSLVYEFVIVNSFVSCAQQSTLLYLIARKLSIYTTQSATHGLSLLRRVVGILLAIMYENCWIIVQIAKSSKRFCTFYCTFLK